MGKRKTTLEQLNRYIGTTLNQMSTRDRFRAEYVLELVVYSIRDGTTTNQLEKVFRRHVSAWQPDRTYG